MIRFPASLSACALALIALIALMPIAELAAKPGRSGGGGLVRVRLHTADGDIVVAVETKRAPITATNFLRYVDEKRLDGTSFYRAARAKRDPKTGLIQGGINHDLRRAHLPIAHEPTSQTGLRHDDGTISMARNAPGTAMGNFFITIGPAAALDARPGSVGYAAFGHIVSGMPLVRRILTAKTYPGGYSIETKGQTMVKPLPILWAKRER